MKYRMTVRPSGEILEIDPVALEAERDGLPGSILQALLHGGVDMDHACGGVGACSTCHIIVSDGGDTIPEADENEEDCLESARGLTLQSRLACQAVPNGSKDLVVEIPSWNINEVKESH